MSALIIVDKSVSVASPVELAIARALETSALIGAVKTVAHQRDAVVCVQQMKGLQKQIESDRKAFKEPYWDMCTRIDAVAKQVRVEIDAEVLRLDNAIGEFHAGERIKAQELERERQRELDRIDQERLAVEREAAAKAWLEQQERLKGANKLKAEAEAAERAEKARTEAAEEAKREAARAVTKLEKKQAQLKADELAREQAKAESEAKAAAELRRLEMERLRAEQQAAVEAQKEFERVSAERAAQAAEALGGPVVAAVAKGQTSRQEFDYEVVDIQLLYRVNPGCCRPLEPNHAEIKNLINTHGVREIKGIRIFPVIKNTIRAGKPIDV